MELLFCTIPDSKHENMNGQERWDVKRSLNSSCCSVFVIYWCTWSMEEHGRPSEANEPQSRFEQFQKQILSNKSHASSFAQEIDSGNQ